MNKSKKYNYLKKDNGITLIALVVTIIVLIILAGISINLILGENGIITKAKQSKEAQTEPEVREKVSMILAEYAIEREFENITLLDFLQEKKNKQEIDEVTDNGDGTITIELNGYELVIDKEGNKIEKISSSIKVEDNENVNLKRARLLTRIPLVSQMESNTAIQGEIAKQLIVSHEYSNLPAYMAFDKNTTNRWNSGAVSGEEWPYIGCEFLQEVQVNSIDLINCTRDDTAIKKIKIQYSIDGNNWIDASESLMVEKISDIQTYKIKQSISAKYWRIQIEENYGYADKNCSISEIQFFEEIEGTEEYIVVPTMKSDTETIESDSEYTPGKVITNYDYEELEEYKAFDNDYKTRWNSGAVSGEEWPYIGYEFPVEVNMKYIELMNYIDKTNIKKFKLQYSLEGIDWIDATESLTCENTTELQRYEINSLIKAKYWRIQIEENYGYDNHNCSIYELEFYAQI